MNETRIVLATQHAGYEQRVRQAFQGALNGDLRRWRSDMVDASLVTALHDLASDTPDVVALGPGMPLETALELAQCLDRERPEISVLLISEPSPELWQRALRAGVRDVLAPDASDAEVRAAFDRALEVADRRRLNLVGSDDAGPRGRVMTVVSPKGGSGKTTVSSNLAVGLAKELPGQVAIVDLDLQFGDLASALCLRPEHTFYDVARAGAVDGMALKAFLTQHPSDFWALCAPETPAEGETVPADQVSSIVQLLAQEFEYVIVDTAAGLTEHTLAALEVSTDIVLLCSMDVPSVRGLRKEIAALDALGMVTQRRHFVLNRSDTKVGLDTADIEATVGMSVDVAVPSSRAVPLSMNQGLPVIDSEPRSAVSKQLQGLVRRFAPAEAPRPSGLLRWMK